jgi:hypothetical protein
MVQLFGEEHPTKPAWPALPRPAGQAGQVLRQDGL